MSDKLKTIDPSKYNITESGQVLKGDKNKIHRSALLDYEYTKIMNYKEKNNA